MEIMGKEEVLRLLAIHRNANIRDYIAFTPNGEEFIDLDNPRAIGKTQAIKRLKTVNGKVTAITLTNGQAARNGGFVYLIRAENGYVKIGVTNNIARRLSHLNVSSPLALEVVGCIKTATPEYWEKSFHQRYADKRVRGEWFVLTDEDIKEILKPQQE